VDAHAHAKRRREETEALFRLSPVFCRTTVLRERASGWELRSNAEHTNHNHNHKQRTMRRVNKRGSCSDAVRTCILRAFSVLWPLLVGRHGGV
jgi:hypothetical protein